MREPPLLLSVPNVSDGENRATIEAIGKAFAPATLLDVHSDPDHGRTVYTLAARQGEVAAALLAGAGAATARIDLRGHSGAHPHVGALDVAPVVYLDDEARGAATAEALTAAGLIGDELDLPVFLYGDLATADDRRERSLLRAGGPAALARRIAAGELPPDYGPASVDPARGAVLVTARPPLVAFNIDLVSDDLDLARSIAGDLRESGGGPPGVRAIGLRLQHRDRVQVSLNVHDYRVAPIGALVDQVSRRAPIAELELVGLAPAAALEGVPAGVPLRAFDPDRHIIENALRSLGPAC
ncbi:MAG: glutamate formiminotransferase [Actinobacteria bacterium]|nr:glutamate formiminotransferase [Actinomycetota bacterium]